GRLGHDAGRGHTTRDSRTGTGARSLAFDIAERTERLVAAPALLLAEARLRRSRADGRVVRQRRHGRRAADGGPRPVGMERADVAGLLRVGRDVEQLRALLRVVDHLPASLARVPADGFERRALHELAGRAGRMHAARRGEPAAPDEALRHAESR